jgi:hypothetical protein
MSTEPQWNDTDMEKLKNSEKTCPSANLSITNLMWIDPGANPGLYDDRPVLRVKDNISHAYEMKIFPSFSFYTGDEKTISEKFLLDFRVTNSVTHFTGMTGHVLFALKTAGG